MLRSHHRFMMGYTRKFLFSLRRPVMIYMVTLSISAQLFFAAIFYWAEVDYNSKLVTFFDSLYFTATYVCFTAVLAAMIMRADPEGIHEADPKGQA